MGEVCKFPSNEKQQYQLHIKQGDQQSFALLDINSRLIGLQQKLILLFVLASCCRT